MKINWFIPVNHRNYNNMPASIWIRCLQIIPYLNEIGIKSQVNSPNNKADIAVFVRWQDEQALGIIKKQRQLGAKIIFDLCVNYFDVTGLFVGGYGTLPEHQSQALKMANEADILTCASSFITARAEANGFKALYLPDSIDLRHFSLSKKYSDYETAKLNAIWSGTSVKAHENIEIISVLKQLNIPFTAVTDNPDNIPHYAKYVPWTYETFPTSIIGGSLCVAPRRMDNTYDLGHSIYKIGVFMAEGVPVLASPIPSYEELLSSGEGGLLCEKLEDWQRALEMILKKPNYLKNWSLQAKQRIQKYSSFNVAQSYRKLFEELLIKKVHKFQKNKLKKVFPKKTVRCIQDKKLAYYNSQANEQFWDLHWQKHLKKEAYACAEQGNLGYLETPCVQFLPRKGRILEAGCGTGGNVLALRKRNWEAEGVDYSQRTVTQVKELYPELPIRMGDVTKLKVPDGTYNGYISLGVVEHRLEGPDSFLKEAYRILAPEGVALISVPYFNYLRRLKARIGCYKGETNGLDFYQYAFTKAEFTQYLNKAGFKIITWFHYDAYKGLKDELSLFRHVSRWNRLARLVRHWLEKSFWVRKRFSHMLMAVCLKENQ